MSKQNALLSLQTEQLLAMGARTATGVGSAVEAPRYGGIAKLVLVAQAAAHPETNMETAEALAIAARSDASGTSEAIDMSDFQGKARFTLQAQAAAPAELTTVEAVANLSRTASDVSAAIDMSDYQGKVRFTLDAGAKTAGTDPTLDVKITHCTTIDGSYEDVDDGDFAQITTTAGVETIELDVSDLEAYVKIDWTIGGTDSPEFPFGVVMEAYPALAGTEELDVTVTHCATIDGSYTAVDDGAFETITDEDGIETLVLDVSDLEAYVKVAYAITGSGVAFTFGVAMQTFPAVADDATLDVKLTQCDTSGGTYEDVTGAAFDEVSDENDLQVISVNADNLKPYLKVAYTIDGSDGLEFLFGVALQGFRFPYE